MADTPERIWLDWKGANAAYTAFAEPPENEFQDGQVEWVRADIHAAELAAALARAENAEGEAQAHLSSLQTAREYLRIETAHAEDAEAEVARLRADLREAAMQSLADMGQAQDAYDAQLRAEAEAKRLRDALKQIVTYPVESWFYEASGGPKTVQTERVVSEADAKALITIAAAASGGA